MTQEERYAFARDCLQSQAAKNVFNTLIEVFPDAAVFWNCGDEENEVEIGIGMKQLGNGLKVARVSLRLASDGGDE